MIKSIIIYILITLFTVVLSVFSISEKYDKKVRYIFLFITILIPSIFSGIRYGIGTDYVIYQKVFKQVLNASKITKKSEMGYIILNKIVAFFTPNFQVLLFIIALMTIGFVFCTIYRKKDKINVPFAVFGYMMLFYQMSFNISRQLLAAAILMFATKYLEKNDKKKYFIFNVLAISIHSVAIIGLPLTFLFDFLTEEKYNKKRTIFYFLMLCIVICNSFILLPIFKLVPSLYYYKKYISFSFQGLGIGIFRYIVLLLLPQFFIKKTMDKDINLYYAISILGFILWMNSYFSDYIAYRISYTFLINLPIVLGYYWKKLKFKNQLIIRVMLLITIMFFWYYDFFFLGAHGTVPYLSVLSK